MKPQNIVIDLDNKLLQINWNDHHASVYDFTYLRRACPCAECQPWKERGGAPGEMPDAVRNAIGELKSVQDVSEVGGYAIGFTWADGHRYGIYNWEYLLQICPCDEHAGKKI
ncbi:MAG: DUF971 domain-containing protein [Chloroflexi bacterium]|nr:DUF971 domain-containing protein [Chloroflexota bacterium]